MILEFVNFFLHVQENSFLIFYLLLIFELNWHLLMFCSLWTFSPNNFIFIAFFLFFVLFFDSPTTFFSIPDKEGLNKYSLLSSINSNICQQLLLQINGFDSVHL